MKNQIIIAGLILQGFTYKTAKQYLYLRRKYGHKKYGDFTLKEIMSILPINKNFDKLFDDLLSMRLLLVNYKAYLPEYYAITIKRNGKKIFLKLDDSGKTYDSEKIVELIRIKKSLVFRKSKFGFNDKVYVCKYNHKNYFLDGKQISKIELLERINLIPDNYLVLEHIEGTVIELSIINENNHFPVITDDSNNKNTEINELALKIANEFPEIEYMHFSFCVCKGKIILEKIRTGIDLFGREYFGKDINCFIRKKIKLKKRANTNCFKIIKRYLFSYIAKKKGFLDYMYRNWLRGKKEDWKTRNESFLWILWAHRKGFYSYRIKQYGLTKGNYKGFLSDYDYKRLRPINNEYSKWIWDKLSFYYILKKYSNYLPKYYYHIIPHDGYAIFLKKYDCDDFSKTTVNDVVEFLQKEKRVAIKPVTASHGDGFYKLEFRDRSFFLNDNFIEKEEMKAFLIHLNRNYVITEYVEMDKLIKSIYAKSVNTIRIMVINRNGNNPVIENAYLRIGTLKTGQTDNISYGGIFAYVDEKNGRFGQAHMIKNHVIEPCEFHPDTNMRIRGQIPFWHQTCEKIIKISRYLSPIEYMGFDIVITDNGFKILEINTHQELHRYPEYNDGVKRYFKEKCVNICK